MHWIDQFKTLLDTVFELPLKILSLSAHYANPLQHYHRVRWFRRYGEKPLCRIAEPIQVLVLLLLVTTHCARENERDAALKAILEILLMDLSLSREESCSLLAATAFFAQTEYYVLSHLLCGELPKRGVQ